MKDTSIQKRGDSTLKSFLAANNHAIRDAMPNVGITPESVAKAALLAVSRNPMLQTADKTSVLRAIVEAASLGLSFTMGRAYLVPFNNTRKGVVEAQFMPGYTGLLDLARRSGEIKRISARAVYEGDTFTYAFGMTEHLHHEPKTEPDDKKLTHAYCVLEFKDGGVQFEVMTRNQIEAVRKRSRAATAGPWVTDYAAMAIKTVIKRALKLAPMSVELASAIDRDNALEAGEVVDPLDDDATPPEPKKSGVDSLAEELNSRGAIDVAPEADKPKKLTKAALAELQKKVGIITDIVRKDLGIISDEAQAQFVAEATDGAVTTGFKDLEALTPDVLGQIEDLIDRTERVGA